MAEIFKKTSFLEEFTLPEITHDAIKNSLIKIGKTISTKISSIEDLPLTERLKYIEDNIYKILGRYKDFIKVIDNDYDAERYIDLALKIGYVAFDTETNNSLDPLTCKLMGLCCYIPNTKPVYMPINHCEPGTEIKLKNNISDKCVENIFNKLKNSDIKMIYHNGKFDIRVCYNITNIYLPIYWDTMIASQLLDENEVAKLKYQYKVHVNPTIDSYNIEKLFTGLPYAWIKPEIFALYAAIDAYDTWLLYKEQENLFNQDGMERLFKLFLEVEMPIVLVTSRMEDRGITLDLDFIKRLDDKYAKGLNEVTEKLNKVLKPYENVISYYQNIGKLDIPVNYESSKQLSIILYDILKIKNTGELSTSKESLKSLNNEVANLILEYRHYSKLRSAFTSSLPTWISTRDNKLHASFNQMGKEENNVRTGRFSSTDPNLQQIPSKERVMRLAFKASPGYCIVGGDFSLVMLAEVKLP